MGEHELPYDFSGTPRKDCASWRWMLVLRWLNSIGWVTWLVSRPPPVKTGQLFVKAIYKIRLGPIARFIGLFNRVPELIYYAALRTRYRHRRCLTSEPSRWDLPSC